MCAELSTPLHHNRAHHFFGRLRVSGSGRRQHFGAMDNGTHNKWVTACLGPTQCCPRKSVLERTCWRLTQEKETLNELLRRSTMYHVEYGVFFWSCEHMKGHVLLLCALWFKGSSVEASSGSPDKMVAIFSGPCRVMHDGSWLACVFCADRQGENTLTHAQQAAGTRTGLCTVPSPEQGTRCRNGDGIRHKHR